MHTATTKCLYRASLIFKIKQPPLFSNTFLGGWSIILHLMCPDLGPKKQRAVKEITGLRAGGQQSADWQSGKRGGALIDHAIRKGERRGEGRKEG